MAHRLRNRDKTGQEKGKTLGCSQEVELILSDYESLDDEYGVQSQPEEEHRDGH